MNFSNYRFTLDIQSYQSQVSLPVMLGDTSRSLYISLTDSGNPYLIGEGCRAVFCAKKPDGNTLFNDCIIEDNTKIRYDFTANTANAAGTVECEIRLYGANNRLITTPRFIMVVDSRVIYDDDIVFSDSERTTIDSMLISETERIANEEARQAAEAERESAEAERNEGFNAALETAEKAQGIADTITQKLEAGEFKGKSVWIRYSAYEDGTDYTEVWTGENYIGIAIAKDAPTDKTDYKWQRFYGDPTSFNELTDVPYSTLMVDEEGYLCLDEDRTIGTVIDFEKGLDEVKETLHAKADLIGGKVPVSQLPSYVDDVVEYDAIESFPLPGERGKIYIDLATGESYRWGGSIYVPLTDWSAIQAEIENKLDKSTVTNEGLRAYCAGNTGNQQMIKAITGASPYTIMLRDGSNQAKVGTPKESGHITNKKYVDDLYNELKTEIETLIGLFGTWEVTIVAPIVGGDDFYHYYYVNYAGENKTYYALPGETVTLRIKDKSELQIGSSYDTMDAFRITSDYTYAVDRMGCAIFYINKSGTINMRHSDE